MTIQNLPTPMPIGAPYAGRPPLFDRWGIAPGRRTRTDQRDYTRRPVERDIWLLDLTGRSVIRCRTDDVSDAGLHATTPVGYGLAIGQRYEVRIAPSDDPVLASEQCGVSLGYATVIRTEVRLDGGVRDQIGFAIRFDVPQLLPV